MKILNKCSKLFKKLKDASILENKYFPYFIIFVFSCLFLLPSLDGVFHVGDDMSFHLANIEAFSKDFPLSIFSKILPDLANDFGFGVGIFYPPLPHIVGAFIYKIVGIFGMGIVTAETILHFLIFFSSGVTMYLLGKEIFKDNKKGLIAALFYITYNYFFVDVIIRDALNESFIFIFMPLVFLGLYNLFYNQNIKKFYICFVIGYIGLMYSHLVMSVYFTLFLLVFLLFYIKDIFNKRNFGHLCLAAVMILVFTSTFTVPMIEHKLSGIEYVSFMERKWTLDSVWNMPFEGYFSYYAYGTGFDYCKGVIFTNLNFIVIIFFVLALIRIFTKKVDKNLRKFLLGVICFGILGIILNSFKGFWLHVPSLLLSIQIVWRLSSFVGFGFALVAAEGLSCYLDLFKKKYILVAMFVLFAFLASFVITNNDNTTFVSEISNYNMSVDGAVREHFPSKIYERMDDFWDKDYKISILDGKGEVKILEDDTPYMKFEVKNIKDSIYIELPRIYYLGYEITDENGDLIKYECNDPGYIGLKISKNGVYEVKYVGTTAYKVAFCLKIFMILLIVCYLFYKRRSRHNYV